MKKRNEPNVAGSGDGSPRAGVTWRAFFIGALMALALGVFSSYNRMLVRSSPMTDDFMPPVTLFLLFLLPLVINVPLRVIRPGSMLGTGELATIYIMMLSAAAVPTRGFVEFLGPTVTGAQYFASAQNHWDTLIAPHMSRPPWIVPRGADVIRAYYEGLPSGEPIPWGAWLLPMAGWLSFCMALSMAMVCMAVILRRQWMDNERLVYPLMTAPIKLVEQDRPPQSANPRALGPIWRSRIFWIGFMIPFLILAMRGLSRFYPAVFPYINTRTRIYFFERSAFLRLNFNPLVIGLLYFVRRDILMGLWVFPALIQVVFGYFTWAGALPLNPPRIGTWSGKTSRAFTGAGAMLVYVGSFLWAGRRHLRDVLGNAFTSRKRVDDSGELLSYRTAVFTLLVCGIFMCAWLRSAGMSWWQSAGFLIVAFIIYLALTRLIAEAGMPVAKSPIVAQDFMTGALGASAFTAQNLIAFGFVYPFHGEMRCNLLAHATNALKVAHQTVKSRRRLIVGGILVAVFLSFVGSAVLTIYYPYRRGGLNLDRFAFQWSSVSPWKDAAAKIESVRAGRGGPMWKGFPLMTAGAVAMGLICVAMRQFPKWPLHPAGLFIGFHWCGEVLITSAFVVWVLKGLIMKWGGAKLYKRLQPFFVGCIVGEVVGAGTWAVVSAISGVGTGLLSRFYC